MYQVLQFHSVTEPSKNHDIWVPVLFGSLWALVQFGFLHIFNFRVQVRLTFGKTSVLVRFVLLLIRHVDRCESVRRGGGCVC